MQVLQNTGAALCEKYAIVVKPLFSERGSINEVLKHLWTMLGENYADRLEKMVVEKAVVWKSSLEGFIGSLLNL